MQIDTHTFVAVMSVLALVFSVLAAIVQWTRRTRDAKERAWGLQESLRQNEERQTLLLRLIDALLPLASPSEIQFTAARLLGEHLRVNRVVYADIEGGDYVIRQSWENGVAPSVERGPVTVFGETLLDVNRRGETVVVSDVRTDARFTDDDRSTLLSSGIAAFIAVMRLKAGQQASALSVESATPRSWPRAEIEFARDVAERTWEAVERGRAEEVLRESEQGLRILLDATGGGSWRWQAQTNKVDWDDRFRALLGFTADETPTFEAWLARVHQEDRPRVLRLLDEILQACTRDSWDNTYRIVRLDGSVLWMQSLGRVNRDAEGRVTRLTGLELDITEQRSAEEALRASEHKFRLCLHAAQLGTWRYDLTSGAFTTDDTGKVLHGYTPDDVIETLEGGGRYVHPDDIVRIRDLFEQAVAERGTCEYDYRVVHPNGETRWVAALGMLQPGTSSFFGIVQDVTARKRVELDLQDRHREQEHTLRLLLESATQGILSVGASGLIVMANATTETMFGWPRGELVGQPLERLVPPAFRDSHAADRAAYFRTPKPRLMSAGMDLVGQRKDGSTFPIEISLNHVTTASGGHAIAFITDVSARKQAEAALRRSYDELERRTLQLRRLASQLTLAEQHAREQLARTLHDGLQQLLFSATMKLDRAVKTDLPADHTGLLQKARSDINEAIEAARTLSVNLFPPVLHVGGLPSALAWLAKRTQEQFRVAVNLTADSRANPEASDVRILLFEAVRELLFNAVKHAHVDRVDISLELRSDDTIHIEVSDKGVGFDTAIAFNQDDPHQVGLGLFSIRERFALLGGRLDIQSAPDQGARFSLTVPRRDLQDLQAGGTQAKVYDSGRRERLVPNDSPAGTSQALRILIADDHVVVRAGLRELFIERPGLQVVGEASNGFEAISKAMALKPDVIIMDVSMPQINGIQATGEIHSAEPYIRILGLSTYDDENSERSMREAGAEAYFTKTEGTDRLLDYLLNLPERAKVSAQHQSSGPDRA